MYIPNVQAMDHSDYCGFMENNLDVYYGRLSSSASHIAENFDSDEVKTKKNDLKKTEDKIKDFCKRLEKHLNDLDDDKKYPDFDDEVYRQQDFWVRRNVENYDEYNSRFEKILANNPEFKKEYDELQLEHNKIHDEVTQLEKEQLNKHKSAVEAGEYQPCGDKYPFGCPKGQSCFWEETLQISSMGSTATGSNYGANGSTKRTAAICLDPNSEKAKKLVAVQQGEETFTIVETSTVAYGQSTKITNEQGEVKVLDNDITVKRGDNSACSIPDMQKMYQSTCYSCKIIMTLITTFMNACGKVYDLTREAGSKVLVIGSMLWLAAFALKLVSAFTNQEPMSILNTLLIFMFKVAAAYIVINVGIGAIVDLFVNPLLLAGADYGLGLLQAANQGIIKVALTSNFTYNGTEIISPVVINKIMALTEGIDKTVSTNLVIGHALTCHSFNAGMLEYTGGLFGVNVTIRIPDLWIWLCGAAIWFCGFMLTLGIGYYLLDVCFKIGFCIMALPIVIGLWPFGPTSGKFTSCMSIIFRSAALFTFLALTTSYALSLISVSLGDLTTFYAKIKAGDAEWVSNTFSISGANFILIMFAYVYSIKMIGATVTGYVGKFFNDSTFGDASPMHMKATQMTAFVKNKVTQAASFAGGVVTHQATRAAGAVAGGAVNFVKNRVNGGKDANKDNKDADKKDNEGKKEGDSPKDNNKPN